MLDALPWVISTVTLVVLVVLCVVHTCRRARALTPSRAAARARLHMRTTREATEASLERIAPKGMSASGSWAWREIGGQVAQCGAIPWRNLAQGRHWRHWHGAGAILAPYNRRSEVPGACPDIHTGISE